jgi:acyl-CoA reductase-like NAD-dependent aldehyde dehydrogenase
MSTYKQYIRGAWVEASNHKTWEVINPATEEVIATVPYGDQEDAKEAIAAATEGFRLWSKTNAFDRAIILKKAAAHMFDHLQEYARTTVLESGKPLSEAIGEWRVAANFFEWYAEEGKRHGGRIVTANRNNKRMSVIHQPLGVVGAITAWNFPAYNPARCWAAALGAGCAVVAKASEYTPLTAMNLVNSLHEAGMPKGVVNLVNGDASAIGSEFLANPAVRKISFTGSTRVGKILMEGAAQTNTRLALELGGNAPVLVFPDVDVKKVAEESVTAKLRNAGQVCIAPQRYLVHESIAGEFLQHASNRMRKINVGFGLDAGVDMGPMINLRQRENLEQLLQHARTHGAEIMVGGTRGDFSRGYFHLPTLVQNTTTENPLFTREIFGPVMPVTRFKNMEEALHLANATEYGLASYVWTNDLKTAINASEQLEFGLVGVNEWYPQAFEAPFGGWKQSGLGYECGEEGLLEYTEKKLISIGV